MTDGDKPGGLRERLPDAWRVEGGDGGAYGYADAEEPVGGGRVPACFSIQPTGELWAATWKDAHDAGTDPRAVADRVTGTRERCVEWVLEQARGVEEAADE